MQFGEREDIGLGALVCLIGAGLLAYVHGRAATPETQAGYPLYAAFQRSDGLMEGAPVRLAGIDVGKVRTLELREGFRARATLTLDDGIQVPSDSAAVIHTDGLFGAKYVEIEPGGATDFLASGDSISFTQDSLIVEDLLERLVAMAKSQQAKCAEALAAPLQPKPAEPSGKAAPVLLVPTDKGN